MNTELESPPPIQPTLASGRLNSFFFRMGTDELVIWMVAIVLGYLYIWPFFFLWLLYAWKRRGLSLKALWGSRTGISKPWYLLWVIPFATLFTYGSVWLVFLPLSSWQPGWVEWWLSQPVPASQFLRTPGGIFLGVILVVGVMPFLEELFFRAVVFRKLSASIGVAKAILLTSAFFALLHPTWLGPFVISVILCLVFAKTNNLGIAIAGHALNNGLAIGMASLAYSNPGAQIEVLTVAALRSTWWLGLACLVISVPLVALFIRRHWPERKSSTSASTLSER